VSSKTSSLQYKHTQIRCRLLRGRASLRDADHLPRLARTLRPSNGGGSLARCTIGFGEVLGFTRRDDQHTSHDDRERALLGRTRASLFIADNGQPRVVTIADASPSVLAGFY